MSDTVVVRAAAVSDAASVAATIAAAFEQYRGKLTPEFQCRFAWQPNSIAFWDNRAAMHHAMWDYFPHKRLGYRVTVKVDKPFLRA